MNVRKYLFFSSLIIFLLGIGTGCEHKDQPFATQEPIKIAVNPWIGYTPLMYLDQNGTLAKLGFKLVYVSSLGENANLLSNHLVDGFAATQYEYLNYKDELDTIVPVFTIDRSAGADKVHSNVDITTLQHSDRPIDVYLEFGSVNEDLLKVFLKTYHLEKKTFRYHHDPQSVIKTLKDRPDRLVIVISYEPFSSLLEKNGIHEVASSRDLDILIVDALFSSTQLLHARKEAFIALKKAFWQAQRLLMKNPDDFYRQIRPYIEGQSLKDFRKSLEGIQWLPSPSPAILKKLEEEGIDTRYML